MAFKRGKGHIGGYETASEYMKERAKQNSIYVRLEDDGDQVVGTFVDDPRIRDVHWTSVEYVDCTLDRPEGCKYCAQGLRVGTKAQLNFYVRDERRMKVIEGGPGWFKNVLKVIKKYGLAMVWFEVERQGAKGDPKTTYAILPDEAISDEEVAEIAATPIHDLWAIGSESFPSDAKRGDVEETKRQRRTEPEEAPAREPVREPRNTAPASRPRTVTPPPEEPEPEAVPSRSPRRTTTPPPAARQSRATDTTDFFA
ncbi:MAG: hypothetical protein AMXMBFR64_57480 [Myxococcales bacterium]